MAETTLLVGEQLVMESDDGALALTSFRVKYESNRGGISAYKSIPLHKVSCCAVTTKKYPLLLILAALASVGVFALPNDQGRVLSAIVALVCFGAYFFLRSGQLEVISDSGVSIAVPTKGLKHELVRSFAEAVASALSKRQ
jgi:hypothetical protein